MTVRMRDSAAWTRALADFWLAIRAPPRIKHVTQLHVHGPCLLIGDNDIAEALNPASSIHIVIADSIQAGQPFRPGNHENALLLPDLSANFTDERTVIQRQDQSRLQIQLARQQDPTSFLITGFREAGRQAHASDQAKKENPEDGRNHGGIS